METFALFSQAWEGYNLQRLPFGKEMSAAKILSLYDFDRDFFSLYKGYLWTDVLVEYR